MKRLFLLVVIGLLGSYTGLKKLSTDQPHLATSSTWKLPLGYQIDFGYSPLSKSQKYYDIQELPLKAWSNRKSEPSASRSSFHSFSFKTSDYLAILSSGYPEDYRMTLEHQFTEEHYVLKAKNTKHRWVDHQWKLPESWVDQEVTLRLEPLSENSRWVGISTPRTINFAKWFSQNLFQWHWVLLYGLHFFFFFGSSLWGAQRLCRALSLKESWIPVLSLMISAGFAYFNFWVYLLHHTAGQAISVFWILLGTFLFMKQKTWRSLRQQQEFLIPVVSMFVTGFLYLGIFYIDGPIETGDVLPETRFTNMPNDHIIPLRFAQRLYDGKSPKQLIGDWLSSDRPPLQAALTLLHRPLMGLSKVSIHYQIFSVILQCFWVPALWVFLRFFGVSSRKWWWILGTCCFSSIFFINSIFVWPKLLAGSLCLIGLLGCFEWNQNHRKQKGRSRTWLAITAFSFGLAMLSHGAAVFILIPIGLYLCKTQIKQPLNIIGFLALSLTLYLPWVFYQSWFDPPGDRLVKWHLAGVIEIDNRSSLETIKEAYRQLDTKTLLDHKWQNVDVLFRPAELFKSPQDLQFSSVRYLFNTPGILWIVILLGGWRALRRWSSYSEEARATFWIFWSGCFLWCLLIFGPGETIVHQGPYLLWMLIFIMAGYQLAILPSMTKIPLFIFHSFTFLRIWFF